MIGVKPCVVEGVEGVEGVGGVDTSDWRINDSFTVEFTSKCSMPVLDAKALSMAELARRCAAAKTPLLIRVGVIATN